MAVAGLQALEVALRGDRIVMSTTRVLTCAAVLFLSAASVARAEVRISEIFAPGPSSTRQFVEVYNDTDSGVDLTLYTILDSGAAKNGHEISAFSGGAMIPAGAMGVIAKDPSTISGAPFVFKANLGVKGGDAVKISTLDIQADFPGSAVSGSDSYQRTTEGWILASPTPGAANASSGSSSDDEGEGDTSEEEGESSGSSASSGSGSATTSVAAAKKAPVSSAMKMETRVRTLGYVGIPLAFQGRATKGGVAVTNGRYFWNFGDGDFREVKVINTDTFTHTYYYPGDYTVAFEYYPDAFAEDPEAVEKLAVKIVAPDVSISRTGDGRDFFIELSNNADDEADLSGWMLTGGGKTFTIPRKTILAAHKKMIISSKVTGFTAADQGTLALVMPSGSVAFVYPPMPATPTIIHAVSLEPSAGDKDPEITYVQNEPERPEETPHLEFTDEGHGAAPADLGASVAEAAGIEDESLSTDEEFAPGVPIAFFGLLSATAAGVYWIRRRKTVPGPGGDFKILDR